MECVNCKKTGHTFRDCKEPTASYGIIAIRYTDETKAILHYLLIRRRDSLSYVDFLRGKYSLANSAYITTLLSGMTRDEIGRLTTTPFETLWTRLWNSQNTRQFRYEFESAKRQFESFRSTGDVTGKSMARYIAEIDPQWDEPEWGFPKGRRSPHEAELSCALREFTEETGLPATTLTLHRDTKPVEELYVGSNGITYRHVYYLATCSADVSINTHNRVQMREVGDIGWFPFEEAYIKIRSTNPEKRAVLGCVHAKELES